MKKTIVTALVVVALGGGIYYLRHRPATIASNPIAPAASQQTLINGTVKKVDVSAHKLSIKEQDGTLATLDVGSQAVVDLGAKHRHGALSSLKAGERVSIVMQDANVKSIQLVQPMHKTTHLARAKHTSEKS